MSNLLSAVVGTKKQSDKTYTEKSPLYMSVTCKEAGTLYALLTIGTKVTDKQKQEYIDKFVSKELKAADLLAKYNEVAEKAITK